MTTQAFLITVPTDGSAPQVAGKADPVALLALVAADADVVASLTAPALVTAAQAAVPTGGIVVIVDKAVITTKNQLRAALRAALSVLVDGTNITA